MRIIKMSCVICLCSVIVAGLLAFQLNSDGYYLGWSTGIVEACAGGCPALEPKDLDLAKSLAAENGQFSKSLQSKWFVFLGMIAVAAVSSLFGLVSAMRNSKDRNGSV